MTDKLWHYIDARQHKHGPVTASVIAGAYEQGELGPSSLVWHDELPQWQSLAAHADVLGITLTRASVPTLNGREVRYANFFHRWAALMIDQWILSTAAIAAVGSVAAAIYLAAGFSFETETDGAAIFLSLTVLSYVLVYLGLSGAYHIHFETSSRHGSLGKQFLGIEVRTEQGEFLDKSTAALRWFSAALSHLSQNIGFLIAAFTEKHQALHDFLAHTIVLERDPGTSPASINRNKRAAIVLVLGIAVMPLVIFASVMFPMLHFIEKQEQAEAAKHGRMAALVAPIQQAIENRIALDNTCLTNEDAEIKPLLPPLSPITSEIYVGLSEDEQACEIYLVWDTYKTLSYRNGGDGEWTCEASHSPADFGGNCQLID